VLLVAMVTAVAVHVVLFHANTGLLLGLRLGFTRAFPFALRAVVAGYPPELFEELVIYLEIIFGVGLGIVPLGIERVSCYIVNLILMFYIRLCHQTPH
jgi:hypothetical protein